jgi:hypothetical protein
MNFTPINERLYILRVKCRFFNYSLINIHPPINDSDDEAKDLFYEELERTYNTCLGNDVKILMGVTNAKIGQEKNHHSTIGKHNLHETQIKMAFD